MTRRPATRMVHAGEDVHRQPSITWPIAPPIVQTSVYVYPDMEAVDAVHDGEVAGYIYGRYGVPNHTALEAAMCDLEGAEAAVATTNGTNAIASTLLAMTSTGNRVATAFNVYGGTRGLLDNELRQFGVMNDYVYPADLDLVRAVVLREPRPVLLWADSIANPSMLTTDIPALASLAREAHIPLIIDNTFATPLHCNPLDLGADLVIHSTTKFIAGHNDTSGGVVLGSAKRISHIREVATRLGAVGAAFEAWLALRGLRTLDVRLRRSSANAHAIAESVEGHPAVLRVHYPGLASDPGHAVALRVLHDGFGSMLALDLGDSTLARAVVNRLGIIRFAETLCGLMSTVVHPRSASYRVLTDDQLLNIGISPGLLRFSIGIEAVEDLIDDIQGALDGIAQPT